MVIDVRLLASNFQLMPQGLERGSYHYCLSFGVSTSARVRTASDMIQRQALNEVSHFMPLMKSPTPNYEQETRLFMTAGLELYGRLILVTQIWILSMLIRLKNGSVNLF